MYISKLRWTCLVTHFIRYSRCIVLVGLLQYTSNQKFCWRSVLCCYFFFFFINSVCMSCLKAKVNLLLWHIMIWALWWTSHLSRVFICLCPVTIYRINGYNMDRNYNMLINISIRTELTFIWGILPKQLCPGSFHRSFDTMFVAKVTFGLLALLLVFSVRAEEMVRHTHTDTSLRYWLL